MNDTSTDRRIWTSENFLYDEFLTYEAETSGREGSSPIEVYNNYLERRVDINTLCNLGAGIMNFVNTNGLEGISPYFLKWCIWWRFRGENLFGIHLFSPVPRLMFYKLTYEYFEEVYPEYEFTYFRQLSAEVCEKGVTVDDLEGAFFDTIHYFAELTEICTYGIDKTDINRMQETIQNTPETDEQTILRR